MRDLTEKKGKRKNVADDDADDAEGVPGIRKRLKGGQKKGGKRKR